jgi:CRISPR-associated endonuclease/helicase Cas3
MKRGGFSMPGDARQMIEGVYGEDGQLGIPISLRRRDTVAENRARQDISRAVLNSLELEYGYTETSALWDEDTYTPTRLGEPNVTLRLALWDGETITPWIRAGDLSWDLSQVTVPLRILHPPITLPDIPDSATEAAKRTMKDQGRWSTLIPLIDRMDGTYHTLVGDSKRKRCNIEYSPIFGLQIDCKID